jgi:hypothetical protein
MTTSDGKWVMGPPEKIWGPKGNAFATDIIQWRDGVVISMTDWMDPQTLATLGVQGQENYGFHATTDTLMYVFMPINAMMIGKVQTVTDNLTYKITKPGWKDPPLQEGYEAVQLHKYITPETQLNGRLKRRFLQDGFNVHYGLIPYKTTRADDTTVTYRHDMRQLMTGGQSYIQTHKSGTVSPTIIPQMDIRVDIKPSGTLRLQIQGTQIGPNDSTLLYIWVLPIEDRDYSGNIAKLQRKTVELDTTIQNMKTGLEKTIGANTTDATNQGRLIEKNEILLKQLQTAFAGIQKETFKPQMDEYQHKIDAKISEMEYRIQNATASVQAQITRELGKVTHTTNVQGGVKEISYYVNGKQSEIPYTGQPETGLIPGGRRRNHLKYFVVQSNTDGEPWDEPEQDGSQSETNIHDTPTGRRDKHIPRTPRAPKSKSRKQLYYEG